METIFPMAGSFFRPATGSSWFDCSLLNIFGSQSATADSEAWKNLIKQLNTYKRGGLSGAFRSEGRKQKSSPGKSDELLNMLERYFEALNLTYLPRHSSSGWSWHLFSLVILHALWMSGNLHKHSRITKGEVVKASSGHYPQPFLISIVWKSCDKDSGRRRITKFIYRRTSYI